MTSLVCVQRPGGSCKVHNNSVVEDIIVDGDENMKKIRYLTRSQSRSFKVKRPHTIASCGSRTNTMDHDALIGHTLKLQEWLNKDQINTLQERADAEAKETRKMYDSVLETEDTFVKDIKDSLKHKNTLDNRKREILHKKWTEQVYRPMKKELDQQIAGENYVEMLTRKRELHKQYLEHVNKKGHVFLDTIAPDEYYPQALHPTRPSMLRAEVPKFHDPLLAQGRERAEEDRIIWRCMTGNSISDRALDAIRLPPLPLVPLGRHGTENATWLAMPMGNIESPVRMASRRRMEMLRNQHQMDFELWSKQQYDPTIIDTEMQLQKRRRFPEYHSSIQQQRDRALERDAEEERRVTFEETVEEVKEVEPVVVEEPIKEPEVVPIPKDADIVAL